MFGIKALTAKVDQALAILTDLQKKEVIEMATLQELQAEVNAEATVDAGLLVLINKLLAAQGDPAALDAILNGMKANIAPLAAALTANTPAA